jgi:hypothetical protein
MVVPAAFDRQREYLMAKIKKWLSARLGAYRELPGYLREVKHGGIELFYGESFLFFGFGIYCYVYAVSFVSVLTFFGGARVLAGYHIWRANYLRLLPKLKCSHELFIVEVEKKLQANGIFWATYLQILPQCLTDAPVEECQGRLLRVQVRKGDQWEPNRVDEPLDLTWSTHNSTPRTLHRGIPRRLNILWTSYQTGLVPAVDDPIDSRWQFPRTTETFRFDVALSAKDCPLINISIRASVSYKGNGKPPALDAAVL